MGEFDREQNRTPDGVDNSFSALDARLMELQPSLKNLMGKALGLFDDVYQQAPHPSEAKGFPVYAVSTTDICPIENVPMARELTVVLGVCKWVRVFRNTKTLSASYPRERLWLWRPEEDHNLRVEVNRTRKPRRIDLPYDIETAKYDDNVRCLGFVGAFYYGQEPFIAEANEALDEARLVAQEHGLLASK